MSKTTSLEPSKEKAKRKNRCADMDMDCADIEDKLKCYLYQPWFGECPYVKSWCLEEGHCDE